MSELLPHPSYARHNLSVQPFRLAALEQQGEHGFSYPIVITQQNWVIDGYARWELAKWKGRPTLNCIEYCLTSEEALEELIRKHRRSQGLTDFIRIELALDLEPYFKDKALLNRQAAGRLKGLSKLTTAEKVNSRTEVARVAQVSVGNVHKVKRILTHACLQLNEAARTCEVSINLAEKWSHEPPAQQQERLRIFRIERGIKKKARDLVAAHLARISPTTRDHHLTKLLNFVGLLNQLTASGAEQSIDLTSIEIGVVDIPGRTIVVTQDLINFLTEQQGVFV